MPVGYQDYYEALGVPRTATSDEIRTAYRNLARRYHPDLNKEPGSADRFKEIAEAYEVLRDPDKRAQYDRLGANWRAGDSVSGQGGPGGGHADGFGGFRGGFAGGRGASPGDVHVDFGGGDFSDFFQDIFGGAGPGAGGPRDPGFGTYPRRGADHEATIDLTLAEVAAGGRRQFTIGDHSYDVKIPTGARDGTRIRLAGEGGPGIEGGPAGDLFLRVHILADPRIHLRGDDLETEVSVTPSQAALGSSVPVPTLTGQARVTVPPGSSSGRRLRLRGLGMPTKRNGRGDLYAKVRITVPTTLSARERKLYEALAEPDDSDTDQAAAAPSGGTDGSTEKDPT